MTDRQAFQPVTDEMALCRDVMVTMRDGVRLATDIYRPAREGRALDRPAPVIIERTPYGKAMTSRAELEVGMSEPMERATVAEHFVRHGYVVVYQDCRGRYTSEGNFVKYLSEGPDGYDTLAWIAAQPWCNGRIGTMGLSYAAHTQMAAACLAPTALATMILDSGGFSNAFTCGIRQGGAFELKQATWAYREARERAIAAGDELARKAIEAENLHRWFSKMPWSEGRSPLRWAPEYEAYLLEQWRHESFDAFWQQVGIHAAGFYDAIPNIPIALISSWFDVYVPTTFENLAGLARNGKRPLALVMGAGLHGDRNLTFAGDVDFGPNAPLGGNVSASWLEFRRRWFDRWLKGGPGDDLDNEPIRLFVMGGGSGTKNAEGRLDHGGRWIRAQEWPLPDVEELSYYLHREGRLSKSLPAPDDPPLSYDFDPADPVPTIGGALTSGQPIFAGGGFDQREDERFFGCRNFGLPLSARLDVLSFETEPLVNDLTVLGKVAVELWAATDAPDSDFTAKLIDVHPPSADYPTGFALNLTDGIFRCRFRHSFERAELVRPGEIMRLRIELFATANLFRAGHRLRLDISSSNFPKFDVNPNTGEPAGFGRSRQAARNTVFLDEMRPSRLIMDKIDTN
ncbi:CocE/NonD family hydrolase [Mesorhizobium sp. C420B]|uniref:CocE/NonD family hydrolase n=1 Tax=unclassified Mesorhizobium TaxID=325217 RepID=UPI0003FF2F15|nr:CocE/NonD family hydrolase [Mesorhizobium sp. LSHC420B00]